MSLRNGRSFVDDMIRPWRILRRRVCITTVTLSGERARERDREREREQGLIYTTTDKAVSAHKSSFDWCIKIGRWISTSGLKLFLQFRYNTTPVFALPPGWFPYYVEWILSFPKAPMGSVSVQVWSSVCAVAVRVMAEVVSSVLLWVGGRIQGRRGTPMEAKKTQ